MNLKLSYQVFIVFDFSKVLGSLRKFSLTHHLKEQLERSSLEESERAKLRYLYNLAGNFFPPGNHITGE